MATTAVANPTSQNVLALLPKVSHEDADFRYMALNDLSTMLNTGYQSFLQHDYSTSCRVVDALITALQDSNGEVQNMAIKCIGPFVLKAPPEIYPPMIDKISMLQVGNTVDNSIPALALREMVVSFPRPVPGIAPSKAVSDAYSAISRVLIVRLVGWTVIPHGLQNTTKVPKGMIKADMDYGTDSNSIDVLTEVARCFGPMLQEAEVRALQKVLMEVFENERASSVLKKKAVTAISALAAYFTDTHLSSILSQMIESLRSPHLTAAKRRLYLTILGAMARSIPRKFGPHLKTLAPFVLSPLSQQELDEEFDMLADEDERDPEVDEVREAALVALEAFFASCSVDMRAYTGDCIQAALRFLKYNPNMSNEDDEDMEGTQEQDEDEDEESDAEDAEADFEQDDAFDDEDDTSWKVRRCATKVLYAIISTRGRGLALDSENSIYEKVAPALISRFKEPEESVRVEVLTTLALLIRTTRADMTSADSHSSSDIIHSTMMHEPSRKRRRGASEASMLDAGMPISSDHTALPSVSAPTSAFAANVTKLGPTIVRGSAELLKSSSVLTKQAVTSLLKDFVLTVPGGLSDQLNQLVDPLIDSMSSLNTRSGSIPVTGAGATATGTTLRIGALHLVGTIAETHSSKVLEPHLAKLIPAITTAVGDRYSKISSEAVLTAETFIRALTPPQSPEGSAQSNLIKLYQVITNRISANDADLEVRQRAIHALGTLLTRTSGAEGAALLDPSVRAEALDLLLDRLKNELTRLASMRAIHPVAGLSKNDKDFSAAWVQGVCLELCAQLRKVSRVLRTASLETLRVLIANPAARKNLSAGTVRDIASQIQPLLRTNDLHLLESAFFILAYLARDNANNIVSDELYKALCAAAASTISGAALDGLLFLIESIGGQGVGGPLMQMLLKDVGISGNPDVLGKVIGTLLVDGGSSIPVKLEDFIGELNTAPDDKRKCLALSVLGEAGLRSDSSPLLPPDLFLSYFASKSQSVATAAAVALGRAAAGNIENYLPAILSKMKEPSSPQTLLLHSVREMLAQSCAEEDILPHASSLWQSVTAASQVEDSRVIGAECIGRLVTIDPKTYLPSLQALLSSKQASARGMAILSLRASFVDSDGRTYNEHLKPVLVPMLKGMLSDTDLENRRQALTTLNSAMHSKQHLVVPAMNELLPLIMRETHIKPELCREVQMGPFRHKVDDGLEVRKSAYETLYALMEDAYPRVTVSDLYDRVTAGIGDDHDIRILCILMLTKLVSLAPEETIARLDFLAEQFRTVLSYKPKENTVKQELEKANEAIKGVLRVSGMLSKAVAGQAGTSAAAGSEVVGHEVWRSYWEWVKKDFAAQLKKAEEEMKEKDR